jgi:hypothetical protein
MRAVIFASHEMPGQRYGGMFGAPLPIPQMRRIRKTFYRLAHAQGAGKTAKCMSPMIPQGLDRVRSRAGMHSRDARANPRMQQMSGNHCIFQNTD